MNGGRTIHTERLLLREITDQDTEQIVKWRSEPDVYQYFKNPHALTAEEHMRWYQNKYLPDECMMSWIALRNNTSVGLFHARKLNAEKGEVSYLIDPKHQKKGYASEALMCIERWMKNNWDIICLIAEIHSNNIRSIKFIQSMKYDLYLKEENFELYRKDCI